MKRVAEGYLVLRGTKETYVQIRAVCLVVVSVLLVIPTFAQAATLVADFDSFNEGDLFRPSLTDGGITFSDLDRYMTGDNPGFTIENHDGTDMGASFTAPNYLTFGGHVTGGIHFSRFGSCQITPSAVGNSVSMDVYSLPFANYANTLTLQAYFEGEIVASDVATLSVPSPVACHDVLVIDSVTFDSLKLVAFGTYENGAMFIGLDNVTIQTIPEPVTLLLLGLGAVMLRRKR